MSGSPSPTARPSPSPVRQFALIAGIIYVLAGLSGFLMFRPFWTPADVDRDPTLTVDLFYGRALMLFPVNILHNFVHLGIGVWGLLSYRTADGARVFARGLAILYIVLAILGAIPATRTLFGLVPLHSHDIWLHAGTAAIAGYFAFASGRHVRTDVTNAPPPAAGI